MHLNQLEMETGKEKLTSFQGKSHIGISLHMMLTNRKKQAELFLGATSKCENRNDLDNWMY